MMDFNVADAAKSMDDAELAASIAAMSAEQVRRAEIPADQRPNQRAVEIAEQRQKRLYGNLR